MSPGLRLGLILLVVALVVGAVAWWQWPAAVVEAPAEATDQQAERVEELRAAIEQELEALESARETRAETEDELQELRGSIEQRQERIEELRRRAEALDGGE